MWSRKPTPVRRAARTGAVERERQADVGLLGLAGDVAGARHRRRILPHARLHRSRVPHEALGAGDRRAGARAARPGPRPARSAPRPSGAGSGAARAPRRSAPRSAGRQHVVGAGDVVAEGGAAEAADEQAAGPRDALGQRLGARAHELEVLGGEGLREGERRVEVGRVDQPGGRLRPGPAPPRAPPRRASSAVGRWATARDRALGPVLGLGEQVERDERPPRRRRRGSRRARSARRSRRSRHVGRPGAWPPGRRRCRARR